MNTRTGLLWHNNGAERIYFTVNPASIRVSQPNVNRVEPLARTFIKQWLLPDVDTGVLPQSLSGEALLVLFSAQKVDAPHSRMRSGQTQLSNPAA